MRDIEELREAIRQFERYQESGWSKSEVPNSACLIRALDALRDNNQLRAENQRLREALKELAYSPVAFTDDRISYVEMQVDKDVLETAKKALEVSADD